MEPEQEAARYTFFGNLNNEGNNNNKPPIWDHLGKVSTTFMVIWGMVYYCFTHIVILNKLHDSPQFQQNFEKRNDMTNGSFILKLRHSKKHSAYIGSCP